MRKMLFLSVIFFSVYSCSLQNNVLKQISNSTQTRLSRVFKNPQKYEVQIIYSRVIEKDGKVKLKDFKYRVEPEAYFYPASTVKLPVGVLSLERINELNNDGVKINKNTTYHLANDSIEHTIAKDIKAMFAISDNNAYNRLFEFLGQDYINSKLRAKGVAPVRISHRFSNEGSEDTKTRQMIFHTENGSYEMPVTNNRPADYLQIQNVIKGEAYIKDGVKINEPFSFEIKNYFPIETQHKLMKRLFFPEIFEEDQTFHLNNNDEEFLKDAMSSLPREQNYDEAEYYDSYAKFFMYGDLKERIPPHIRIYNKVGYAYGTLTETAYIKDFENDVEFLVSATLLVNENRIYNDNKYEYDEVGIPFMAALGREIYKAELARKK